MQLLADADALQRSTDRIASIKSELEKELSMIEQAILSLDADWQGNAERVYASKIVYIKNEYKKLIQFYDGLITLIKNVSDRYSELEKSVLLGINQI